MQGTDVSEAHLLDAKLLQDANALRADIRKLEGGVAQVGCERSEDAGCLWLVGEQDDLHPDAGLSHVFEDDMTGESGLLQSLLHMPQTELAMCTAETTANARKSSKSSDIHSKIL